MADWQTLSSEEVYQTPWIRVRRDEVRNHNGKPLTYSVVELRYPSVFIVAMNKEGKVLLHRNYRYTLGAHAWEVPAGHSDGEDVLVAAKRELMEETGLASEDWTNLGTLYQAAGIGRMPLVVFLARNIHPASGERDVDEEITDQRFVSFADIERMVRDQTGDITGSGILSALYLAKIHLEHKE